MCLVGRSGSGGRVCDPLHVFGTSGTDEVFLLFFSSGLAASISRDVADNFDYSQIWT